MATIENMRTGASVLLNSYHLFGRGGHLCNTHVESKDVSRFHATIYWTKSGWFLRDHSLNGTQVDSELFRKTYVQLHAGSEIRFSSTGADVWRVADLDRPYNYLRSLSTKNKILVLDSCRVLPDEQKPEVMFYASDNNDWYAESQDGRILLTDGRVLNISGEAWEYVANEALLDTSGQEEVLRNVHFVFSLSPDEEDIRLKLLADNEEYDLGRHAYNYLLLTLTRKRLEDFEKGFSPDDQGWLSMKELEKNVSKELGHAVDKYYLNLQIFRLRKQFMKMKPFGNLFSKIIERRTGELRFAFPQLKVIKDDVCIGEIVC